MAKSTKVVFQWIIVGRQWRAFDVETGRQVFSHDDRHGSAPFEDIAASEGWERVGTFTVSDDKALSRKLGLESPTHMQMANAMGANPGVVLEYIQNKIR